jgi:hypothetical protein
MDPTKEPKATFVSQEKSDYHEVKPLCPFRDNDCTDRCALYVTNYTTTPPSGRCALKDLAKT